MCEAFCFNSLEKFKIKSPRTPKHGILNFLALSSKYFARLSSTIVYKIIMFSSVLDFEIILSI